MEPKLYKFCIFKYIDEEGTKNLHLITLMNVCINFGKKHFSKNHEEGKTHIKDNKISSCLLSFLFEYDKLFMRSVGVWLDTTRLVWLEGDA